MPDIYTPNCASVEMIYQFQGERVENVYNVRRAAPPTEAELQALWTLMRDWEQNTARHFRSDSVNCVLISIRSLVGPGAPVWEAPVNPVIVGGIAQQQRLSFVTITAKHTTSLGGRSYRGRSYWIGVPEAQVLSGGVVSVAYANGIVNAYNTLRNSLAAAGWTFVVISRYSGVDANGKQIPRPQGIATPITATSVELGVDTQRKRKKPYQV